MTAAVLEQVQVQSQSQTEINKAQILGICHTVRQRLIKKIGYSGGYCYQCSIALRKLFGDVGIVCDLLSGNVKTPKDGSLGHWWLRTVDGLVVDITADQFNQSGCNFPDVYVSQVAPDHDGVICSPYSDPLEFLMQDDVA